MATHRWLVTACMALLLTLSQASAAIDLTREEQAFIDAHPTIVVGGEMDWPPMDFVDEQGVYRGAAKDYLDEIAAKTGISFRIVTGYTWSELLERLRSRQIDMVPMMYWTAHRGHEFNLSNPYITVRHYVFTRGKRADITGFEDMDGLTMAIPQGYAHIEYLSENHPRIKVLEVPGVVDAMDAVIVGKADAFIENTASVAYYTENQHIIGLDPAFTVDFGVNNVHMASRKDWPMLRNILQKALDEISAESATRIISRWTGSEATAKTFLTSGVRLTPEEHAYLKRKGVIVACVNADRMPLEAVSGGKYSGMTADYLNAVSEQLRIPIRSVSSRSWQDLQSKISAGLCDISPLALDNASNAGKWELTEPYIGGWLATRADERFFGSLADLIGHEVAVVEGYADVDQLRLNYADTVFLGYPNVDAGLAAVASGEVFGMLDYVHVLSTAINRDYQGKVKISGNFRDESPGYSIAFHRPEPQLASTITKVLQSFSDAQRQNIYHKWVAVSIEKQTDYTLLMRALGVVALVMVIFYFRYRDLHSHREEVKNKNAELESLNEKLESQTEKAMQMAYHDQLTGLSNRAKLLIDLQRALKLSDRSGSKLAVLFLDLDRFKNVNDSLGHDVGDKLLQAVAGRIAQLLRETDILCRIGGDEFIVVLEAISDNYSPSIVAQRIINTLNEPFRIDVNTINIGTSIGISVFPDDSTDQNVLLKYADTAMYSAKDSGRNKYSYFREELSQKANRLTTLESALRRAIENEEFSLVFQPIIDTQRRCVSKVEALIRWHHPALGNISPEEFIPIAEEFGHIVSIGEWVLDQACQAVPRFEKHNCGLSSISINVSSVEFRSGDLGKRFKRIISRHKVRPEQIDLEITEGYMLDRDQYCEEELRELRSLGHAICVDDFGTGYSSLNYMKRLPLNIIKIDRSFIKNIPADINDVKISEAIISLSNSLGYEVVAEGVETEEQFEYLLSKSCAFVQGYYFSEGVTATDLPQRIADINESLLFTAKTAPTIRNILG